MNAIDSAMRRLFLSRMSALAATLCAPSALMAATARPEREHPDELADQFVQEISPSISALEARDVTTVSDWMGLALGAPQVEEYLRDLKSRLTPKRAGRSIARAVDDPGRVLATHGTDAGPWLAALLGAAVGSGALGEQRVGLGARLGALAFNDSAPAIGVNVMSSEEASGFANSDSATRLSPLDPLPARPLAPLWRQVATGAGLPRFGQTRLPDSSIVVAPRRFKNTDLFTVRRANSAAIGQDMQWDHERSPGLSSATDFYRAAMYVVLQSSDGSVEMRAHPVDMLGLLNTGLSGRMLSQVPIFLGLCGGADARVLAAGHLIVDSSQSIWGLTSDLGRIFLEEGDATSGAPLSIASGVLGTLGYELAAVSMQPIADLLGSGQYTLKCGG